MAGRDLAELDLHRPHVDEVKLNCPECGGTMARVLELIDVWFDSGSMPVAQWHYPFDNEDNFKQQFPADYICEAVDQTRGWFYSLHAISSCCLIARAIVT
jgi:isoleucyl-tRNA synthetase